jgi:hypothetical protein
MTPGGEIRMKRKRRRNQAPAMRASELVDGEPFWVKTDGWLHCCDCGSRHHFTIEREISKTKTGRRVIEDNKDWLILKFYKDDLGTKRIRWEKGIVLTKRKGTDHGKERKG